MRGGFILTLKVGQFRLKPQFNCPQEGSLAWDISRRNELAHPEPPGRKPCRSGRRWAKFCALGHGTRLFYELLSCGEPFRRMGRGGWPAMRSLQQWMASLWAARRIFLSRSKPTRKID